MPVYVAKPGGYVGRASDGGVESTRQWVRGGSTLLGTGLSYETVSGDEGELIEYVEQVGNLAGLRPQKRVVAQPEAFPITVQFRDSVIEVSENAATGIVAADYTRKMTIAFRIYQENVDATRQERAATGAYITSSWLNQPGLGYGWYGTVRIRIDSTNITAPIVYHTGGNTPHTVAMIVAIDLDGGLPGGKTISVWSSTDGDPFRLCGDASDTHPTAKITPCRFFGNNTTTVVGANFDITHWLWIDHTVALDPATHWPFFFNADGTVKNLGPQGLVNGFAPSVYIAGLDWEGSGATIRNSGRTENSTIPRYRTPLALVMP